MAFRNNRSGFNHRRLVSYALIGVLGILAVSCNRRNMDLYFDAIFEVSRETEIRLLGRAPQAGEYREKINALAGEIEKGFSASASVPEKTSRVNTYLFSEWGLVPDTVGEDIASSCITRVLDERRGSCVGITALYLCLGEKLGLPLHGVLVGGHVFVRHTANGISTNIETLRKGIARSDSFYTQYFCAGEGSCSMRDLSKREFIGVCYFNLGNAYRKSGFHEDASLKYEEALARFPQFEKAKDNAKQTRKLTANGG